MCFMVWQFLNKEKAKALLRFVMGQLIFSPRLEF